MSAKLEQSMEKLKMTGVRMTPQRHAILSYLLETMSHPTANEIYRALESKFPSMSVATVYNNLKVFIDSGLIREMTYGDDSSRFDADMTEHYHAVCDHCGKIVDFNYPKLEDMEIVASRETGFEVNSYRLEVRGLCPSCSFGA